MADVRVDVERATRGEVEQVAALVDAVIGAATVYSERARREERAKYDPAGLAAMLEQDPDSVLLARVRGRLAGFALSRYDDGLLWLSWLGVVPQLRRGGVARALLARLEHTAPARGCHALWCDCRTDNAASISLLTASGFRRLADLPDHWYGQDFVLWRRDLADAR